MSVCNKYIGGINGSLRKSQVVVKRNFNLPSIMDSQSAQKREMCSPNLVPLFASMPIGVSGAPHGYIAEDENYGVQWGKMNATRDMSRTENRPLRSGG